MIMSIFLYIMYLLLIYWGLLAVMFALFPLSQFDMDARAQTGLGGPGEAQEETCEQDANMSRSVPPSDRERDNMEHPSEYDSDTSDDEGYNEKNDTCIDTISKTTHRRSLHRCDD